MKTVRSYNAYSNAEKDFENGYERFNKAEWEFRKNECLARDVLPTAASQIVIGAAFAVGAVFAVKGQMTIGALIAVIAYLPSLVSSLNGIMKAKLSINSIENILGEFDNILNLDDEKSSSVLPDFSADTVVSIENADFSYDRENFNLHIDNLEIKKGEFVAIVGGSGGGKSSVMDIVNKFFAVKSGNIKLFGKNIDEIDTDSLRGMYSVAPQNTFLFNDTVEKNISFPQEPDSARINEVIEKAQLREFVDGLPEREKTVISDFGENISGGESQRISIARALYRDAPVMLLDEPTAALDAETSKKIFDMLSAENRVNGKTILMITHDVKKAFYADKEVVIDGGRIAESGTPEELQKNDGLFNTLLTAQAAQNNEQ